MCIRDRGRAPDLGRRCLVPWTAILTVSVSKRDVGRAYRCYVYYRLYGQYHNSSPATYVLRGYIQPVVLGSVAAAVVVVVVVLVILVVVVVVVEVVVIMVVVVVVMVVVVVVMVVMVVVVVVVVVVVSVTVAGVHDVWWQ